MREFRKYVELIIWMAALLLLIIIPPGTGSDFTFCILKLSGFNYCPGCGIGHSMTEFMQGRFQDSFNSHPLGGVAVIMIILRICSLIQNKFHFTKPSKKLL